jgi:hypothetical protein
MDQVESRMGSVQVTCVPRAQIIQNSHFISQVKQVAN